MSWEFLDYDPLTGEATWYDYDPIEDVAAIKTESADLSSFVDYTKAQANEGVHDDRGKDARMWKYASLPASVIVELHAKGIDITNREHHKRMLREINTNYPWLKTTHKFHS